MRCALVLVALLGCDHFTSSPTPDAPGDPTVCKADLESAIDRTCSTPDDCVLVASLDCCGVVMLGVAAGSESTFAAAEAAYEACLACPPLGCNHADQAEDGSTPGSGQSIVATCDGSRCKSVVAAASCAPSGGCATGPSCGNACCGPGERCDNGTCRCGSNPACGVGDTCAVVGPAGGDTCGSFCCGASGPCPQ